MLANIISIIAVILQIVVLRRQLKKEKQEEIYDELKTLNTPDSTPRGSEEEDFWEESILTITLKYLNENISETDIEKILIKYYASVGWRNSNKAKSKIKEAISKRTVNSTQKVKKTLQKVSDFLNKQ